MDKTALLKKIRALAEHGVGGEAENAEKLLARMMKKYGISEAELDEETRVRHDFTYHGGEEKKILKQVVYKVTGGYTYELVYTASGRKVRTQLGADCTPAEKVEIEYLFDFYKKALGKRKGRFPRGLHSKAPYLCNTRRHRAAGNEPRGVYQNECSHARHERRKSAPSYRGGEIKEE